MGLSWGTSEESWADWSGLGRILGHLGPLLGHIGSIPGRFTEWPRQARPLPPDKCRRILSTLFSTFFSTLPITVFTTGSDFFSWGTSGHSWGTLGRFRSASPNGRVLPLLHRQVFRQIYRQVHSAIYSATYNAICVHTGFHTTFHTGFHHSFCLYRRLVRLECLAMAQISSRRALYRLYAHQFPLPLALHGDGGNVHTPFPRRFQAENAVFGSLQACCSRACCENRSDLFSQAETQVLEL